MRDDAHITKSRLVKVLKVNMRRAGTMKFCVMASVGQYNLVVFDPNSMSIMEYDDRGEAELIANDIKTDLDARLVQRPAGSEVTAVIDSCRLPVVALLAARRVDDGVQVFTPKFDIAFEPVFGTSATQSMVLVNINGDDITPRCYYNAKEAMTTAGEVIDTINGPDGTDWTQAMITDGSITPRL